MLKILKLDAAKKYQDVGLLIMRVGLGISFLFHGWPKMVGGPEVWAAYGERMALATGIGFLPTFWGFMAAVAELIGGALIIVGLMTRPATILLFTTMVVATLYHFNNGDGFGGFSHPMEVGFAFVALFFWGAGRFSLDNKLG